MAFNKQKVMNAARRHATKGNIDKAIREYLRIVEDDPKDVRVWLKIADLYAKQGQKEQACQHYEKVASYYSEQGFYLKAVAVYKQILKVNPQLAEMNLKLAHLYKQLGLKSDAVQHFEHVAAHFTRQGNAEAALQTIRQLVEIDPDNVATRIKLAELHSKLEQSDKAIQEFKKACHQLKKLGRHDDYLKVAERLLWHDKANIALAKELATSYLAKKDAKRAIPKLQLCFKSNPKDPETLTLLADAFQGMGQNDKACSVLKELAKVYEESGQSAKAKECYRKVLAVAPDDAEANASLSGGRSASKSEISVEAIIEEIDEVPLVAAEVKDDRGGDDEVVRMLNEADVYIKYGLHQKALAHLESVFALAPSSNEARLRKKSILIELGRNEEAIGELLVLAETAASSDKTLAGGYLREIISIDATHDRAHSLAKRWGISLVADDDVEVVQEIASPMAAAAAQPAMMFDAADAKRFDADLPPRSEYPSAMAHPIPPDMLDPGESAEMYGELASGSGSREMSLDDSSILEIGDDAEIVEEADEDKSDFWESIPDPDPEDAKRFDSAAMELDFEDSSLMDISEVDATAPPSLPSKPTAPPAMPKAPMPTPEKAAGSIPLPPSLSAESEIVDDEDFDFAFDEAQGGADRTAFEANPFGTSSLAEPLVPEAARGKAKESVNPFAVSPTTSGGSSIEEELEEVDFFIAQQLFDDARDILTGLLARAENHPDVVAKVEELEKMVGSAGAATVIQEDSEDLSEEEVAQHYDLGLAYKDMGLYEEAIQAFRKAAADAKRETESRLMVGLCYREEGDQASAVKEFEAALKSKNITGTQLISLQYELAASYEALDDREKAIQYFTKVMQADANYLDAAQRAEQLRSAS